MHYYKTWETLTSRMLGNFLVLSLCIYLWSCRWIRPWQSERIPKLNQIQTPKLEPILNFPQILRVDQIHLSHAIKSKPSSFLRLICQLLSQFLLSHLNLAVWFAFLGSFGDEMPHQYSIAFQKCLTESSHLDLDGHTVPLRFENFFSSYGFHYRFYCQIWSVNRKI